MGSVTNELVYVHAGLGDHPLPYLRGWELQRQVHEQRVSGAIPDTCLLLEHEPVYTAGKRTSPLDRPGADAGAPVIDVDRGGKITWHGPGQLVGYPIVRLAEPVDVIAYVRALEEALIHACADAGLATVRVAGRSGVWVPGRRSVWGPSPPGPQGGRDRHPGVPRRDHARLRAELRLRPGLVRPVRAVRHPRRRGDQPDRRARPAGHRPGPARPGPAASRRRARRDQLAPAPPACPAR